MSRQVMFRSCSRCGRIHEVGYVCPVGRRPLIPKTNDQRLRSKQKWTDKSIEIREASHYLCAICQEEGIYNYAKTEVHHITKLKDDEEGLLDNYNLICLCKYHHELADEGKIDAEHLKELARAREDGHTPPSQQG